MPRFLAASGLLALLALGACGEPARPRAPERGADKARLFADPGLVPTREGERARRELALAGQIRGALETMHDVESVSVDVELAATTPRVLATISARTDDAARLSELEHYANEAATAVVGATAEVDVLLDVAPAPEPTGPSAPALPLAFALLGLGVSAGIAAERYRNRSKSRGRG